MSVVTLQGRVIRTTCPAGVEAIVHSLVTGTGNLRLLRIALVIWPLITGVPAFLVALVLTALLRETPENITITDPVANVTYILNSKTMTGQKLTMAAGNFAFFNTTGPATQHVVAGGETSTFTMTTTKDGQPTLTFERDKDKNWKLAKGDGTVNQSAAQSLVTRRAER